MNPLPVTAIPASSITVPTLASDTPVLLTPQGLGIESSWSALHAFALEERERIRAHLADRGALLLRGFELDSSERFQELLLTLGHELMDSNLGGASPRPRVQDRVFLSTAAPRPFIIGYHTEFVYQNKRPGMIAFHCQEAPSRHGETPFFDCARVCADLDPTLRDKLATLGVRYHRRFYSRRSLFNFRKTWSETFYTRDRRVVERYFEDEGASYRWEQDGTLVTELPMPAILTDPVTGTERLAITMFNGESFAYNFWHFQERYSNLTRYVMDTMVRRETRPGKRFLYITFGDSTPFSREESEAIQKAAWRNAIIHRWQRGDLLLLDNRQWAHARLNVASSRKIVVAMGDEYDLRDEPGVAVRPPLTGRAA